MARITGGAVQALAGCAAVFEAADPPRSGTVAFWDPAGGALPQGTGSAGELTVAVPGDERVTVRRVPALRLPVGDAVPVLTAARRASAGARGDGARPSGPHPAAAFWGA